MLLLKQYLRYVISNPYSVEVSFVFLGDKFHSNECTGSSVDLNIGKEINRTLNYLTGEVAIWPEELFASFVYLLKG